MRKRAARKGRKPRRARARVPRTLNPQNQGATIVESIVIPAAVVTDAQIGLNHFDLSFFPRAQQCASLFKHYKAEYCEWEYVPRYNLFTQGNTAGSTIPYMYVAMNRTQDASLPPALGQCQGFMTSQGAVPRKFTNKIVIRYKPNWCSPGLIMQRMDLTNTNVTGVAQMGTQVQYGWLASPDNQFSPGSINTVQYIASPANPFPAPNGYNPVENFPLAPQYNGHYTWFDSNGTESFSVGDVVLRVKWAFKHPHFNAPGPREPDPSGNLVEVAAK